MFGVAQGTSNQTKGDGAPSLRGETGGESSGSVVISHSERAPVTGAEVVREAAPDIHPDEHEGVRQVGRDDNTGSRDSLMPPTSDGEKGTSSAQPDAVGQDDGEAQKRGNWRLRPIGQALGMYILADDGEDLYIIDQHAAHERVLYERFTKQMDEVVVHSIPLLTPLTFHLSPGDAAVLSAQLDTLAQVGLSFEPFGGYSYLLRSIPAVWDGLDAATMAQDVVSALADDADASDVKLVLREKIIMRACKAAIKANHRLSQPEMNALVDAFSQLDDPFHCPHGRPVFVRLTNRDLEKGFRRIV